MSLIKRLLPESYPELPWMQQLAPTFNAVADEVVRLENKNIQINAHVDGEIREFVTDGVYPLSLAWTRANKPTIVMLGGLRRVDGSASGLTFAPYVDWTYNTKGQIQINSILGITASPTIKWYVTVLILTK